MQAKSRFYSVMKASPHNVRTVFIAAVALESSEERARYLDGACADQPELRRRVEELLRAHDRPEALLMLDDEGMCPSLERPGTVIGSYLLLEEIGDGAFGRVFMAQQRRPVRRRVALKVLKAGMDTREMIARFEAERQALALMDHPNIATVFDAGTTETGRPYFVMELVKGVPITEYCDAHNLSMSERLSLFIQVCQAVQHAHQKAIIHRDLKPGNVLITEIDGGPVVKVIDFGIAKALEKDRTRRYATAGALAEDIQRHLDHQPVSTGPPGTLYRLGKFVRRHRTGVALSATALVALLLGLSGAAIGFVQAVQQRDRAVLAEGKALQERDRALKAGEEADGQRNHAEGLAAEAAMAKGQMKLEKDDTGGLLDLAQAYEPARSNPPLQQSVGRLWSTWNANWDRRLLFSRPVAGQVSPDFLTFASDGHESPDRTSWAIDVCDTLTGARLAGPLRHESPVRSRVFTPDGRLLATLTDGGVIRVWDCRSGQEIRSPCETNVPGVSDMVCSPCGRYLAAFSPGRSGTVAFLPIDGAPHSGHLLEHHYPIGTVGFSPDGEILAISATPDLQLWRTADLKPALPRLSATGHPVLDFSGDSALLAFDSRKFGGIGLLDLKTLQVATGSHFRVRSLSFSHDGRLLAGAAFGGTVFLWHINSLGQPYAIRRLALKEPPQLAFSRDDTLLAIADSTGFTRVLSAQDGQTAWTLPGVSWAMTFLSNDLLGSRENGTIRFWDLGATPLPDGFLPHDAAVTAMAFDDSGRFLALGGKDELQIWAMLPSPKLKHIIPMSGTVSALTYPKGDRQFVAFSDAGVVSHIDPTTGDAAALTRVGRGFRLRASLSPDGRTLLLYEHRLYEGLVVDTRTGDADWLTREFGIQSAAFSPNSKRMGIGTSLRTLEDLGIYDITTEGRAIRKAGHDLGGLLFAVAFHPAGGPIAVSIEGPSVRLYDPTEKGWLLNAYVPARFTAVDVLHFSPDGSLLALAGPIGGELHGVELLHVDLKWGLHLACEALLCNHAISCVAFSPDGRFLVAGGDGATRYWHLPLLPESLADVASATRATLGIHGPSPPDSPVEAAEVEAIRARLVKGDVLSARPIDSTLAMRAVVPLRQLARDHPDSGVYRTLCSSTHVRKMDDYAERGAWTEALANPTRLSVWAKKVRTYKIDAHLSFWGRGTSPATGLAVGNWHRSVSQPTIR